MSMSGNFESQSTECGLTVVPVDILSRALVNFREDQLPYSFFIFVKIHLPRAWLASSVDDSLLPSAYIVGLPVVTLAVRRHPDA